MLLVDYSSLVAHATPTIMAVIYNAAGVLAGVFLKTHWRLGLYAVLLMTGFNFFSHGTQDFYVRFLQQQGYSTALVSTMSEVRTFRTSTSRTGCAEKLLLGPRAFGNAVRKASADTRNCA